MKKILLAIIVCFSLNNTVFAQLPNGSIAPDFTLTDLNGTTHNLYTYLDQGYTVFLDFSAVWCGPCWSYHTSGALENLYEHHGPAGYPNVDPTTTDDVMVFFIEGDGATVANLGGSGGGTQGDWITGTPYPIICTDGTVNTTAVSSAYAIGYWPTVYKVCPDRLVTEAGQNSNPYSLVSSCPPPPTHNNDARTFSYDGPTESCGGDITPTITFQNYGLTTLTSLDIVVSVNGAVNSTTPWTGSLPTYNTHTEVLPTITGLNNGDLVTIETVSPNGVLDADPTNNPVNSFGVQLAPENLGIDITISIVTDQYATETSWVLKNGAGVPVAQSPAYSSQGSQPDVTTTLNPMECYTFTIYDSYGDGMCCQYGQGSYTVSDNLGNTIASGGQFADEESAMFRTGSGVASASWDCDAVIGCFDPGNGSGQFTTLSDCQAACNIGTSIEEENDAISIYPNPVRNELNISGKYDYIEIYDAFGKLIFSSTAIKTINVDKFNNGVYIVNITTNDKTIANKITISK